MTTHCRFCGEAVRPNTMFCPACGQIIGGDAPRPQSAPPFATTGGGKQDERAAAPAPAPASLPPVPLPDAPSWARPAPAAPAPAAPAAPAPSAATAAPGPSLALVLPGGERIPVDRMLVLGRQPAVGAAQRGGLAVEVADPARSMSRVHLVVEPADGGGARATDPGSGNGTVVERGRGKHPLVKDTPFELAGGDRLVLGDVVVAVA